MLDNLLSFYALNEKGSAQAISKDQWHSSSSLTWVHGNIASMKDILQTTGNLSPLLIDAVLSKQTQPRIIIHDDCLIMTCRFIDARNKKQSNKIRSLRMVITKSSVMTIQNQPIQSIHDIEILFQEGIGPTSSSSFLLTILSLMTDQWSSAIYQMEDKLSALESKMNTSIPSPQFDEQLKQIRQKIIITSRYLKPQRDAFAKLLHSDLSWVPHASFAYLSENFEAHSRMVQDLSSAQARAEIIHEQQISIGQQKANKGLYWLTIVATIFMPLNLIAGLLGMNVTGIPGSHAKYGFLTVCVTMLVIAMLLIIYFKKSSRL